MKLIESLFEGCSEEQKRKMRITLIFIRVTVFLLILFLLVFFISLVTLKKDNDINNENIVTEQQQAPKPRISANGPGKVYYYNLSREEKIMIAKVVWAEARGECYEGKVAVAAVVLNRYRFDENKWDFTNDTIESLIFQKNQFASISNVTMQDLEKYPDCLKSVEDACKGYDPTRATFKDGALYFYDPGLLSEKAKKDREGIEIMTIGNHNFHVNFEKVN